MLFSPLSSRNIISPSFFLNTKREQEKREIERLCQIPVVEDPLPQHTIGSTKTATGITCILMGGLTAWYGGKGMYNMLPSIRGNSTTHTVSSNENNDRWFSFKNPLSCVTGFQAIPMFFLWRAGINALSGGGLTLYQAVQERNRGRLDLKAVYKDLHQAGIQGQGMKVAIIDIFPRQFKMPSSKKEKHFYQSKMRSIYAEPHGVAVTKIIRKAVPQAEIVTFPALNPISITEAWKAMDETISASKNTPQEMSLQMVQNGLRPIIQDMAESLRKAVDLGVNVVNVSLSPEKLLPAFILFKRTEAQGGIRKQGLLMALTGVPNLPSFETEKAYYERLSSLLTELSDIRLKPIQQDLLEVFQPWYDALAYAAEKNVLVVVSAGNMGAAPEGAHAQGRSHINLIGLKSKNPDHLLAVGSTDEQGNVSEFSSEWNNQIKPDIAANGSGQLNTQGSYPTPSFKLASYHPIAPVIFTENYKNPYGTSFSAPDITGLYALLQSARKADQKPLLSTRDFQEILKLSAKPVKKKDMDKYKGRIFASKQTASEQETLTKKIDCAQAEYDALKAKSEELGISEKERDDRKADRSNFMFNMLSPLWSERSEIWKLEEQIAEQYERESMTRQTGPYGSIAGRRLHTVALGRAFKTDQERFGPPQDVQEVD